MEGGRVTTKAAPVPAVTAGPIRRLHRERPDAGQEPLVAHARTRSTSPGGSASRFWSPSRGLVLDVLAEMRRQRRAFAVVVDEHGGVEGVLTVKDLLGALVGDLPDEFDPDDEPDVVRVDGSRWLVDGRMSVDDVRDRLDINLPEGEYVTLGGFLFDAFGHIPTEGRVAGRRRLGAPGGRDGQAPDRQGGGQTARTTTASRASHRWRGGKRSDPRRVASRRSGSRHPSILDGLWRSLVSALRSGRRGPRFKSGQPDSESLQVNS